MNAGTLHQAGPTSGFEVTALQVPPLKPQRAEGHVPVVAHGQAPCGPCSGASERSTLLSGSGSGGGVLEPELGGGTSVLPLHAPAATSTSHTHPLKAHAQLCVLGSLEKPALSGRKPGVAVMVASGMSPSPPKKGTSVVSL